MKNLLLILSVVGITTCAAMAAPRARTTILDQVPATKRDTEYLKYRVAVLERKIKGLQKLFSDQIEVNQANQATIKILLKQVERLQKHVFPPLPAGSKPHPGGGFSAPLPLTITTDPPTYENMDPLIDPAGETTNEKR